MFSARSSLWIRFRFIRSSSFCSNARKNNDKVESSVSTYEDAYKKLDKLDFMTAAKILFTDPPKKKKFGIDFHLVQLFFACMPSLAVYFVAQYARYEMRRMDAELEEKKKKEEQKKQEEEEKARELELKVAEERFKSDPMILEVKERLGKLEDTINEIVIQTKKQSSGSILKSPKDDGGNSKHSSQNKPSDGQSEVKSSSSMEKNRSEKGKSGEPTTASR